MTAAYDIRETRRLADDLVLGYLSVDFAFIDRPVLTVYLSVIVRRISDVWLISHYQVPDSVDQAPEPASSARIGQRT